MVVNFGNDVPANLLASIVLQDTPALDGQLQRLNGSNVTFALDGAGDLVGSADGFEVIRIHIVSAVAGPGAGEVTYTYSATLSQPLEHANAALENTDLLSGVTFQVTDKDGDPQTGTFSVTVFDDVPQANDNGPVAVAEDTAVIINVFANDVAGADGVSLTTGVALTTGPTQGCCGLQQQRHLHLHAERGRARRGQLHLHDHGRRRRHLDGDGDADACGGFDAASGHADEPDGGRGRVWECGQ